MVSQGLEALDIFAMNTNGHNDLREIGSLTSKSAEDKQEYLLAGSQNHIMIMKVNKHSQIQFFHRLHNVLVGNLTDAFIVGMSIIACGSNCRQLYMGKLREEFALKSDTLDFRDFGHPETIELGKQNCVVKMSQSYDGSVLVCCASQGGLVVVERSTGQVRSVELKGIMYSPRPVSHDSQTFEVKSCGRRRVGIKQHSDSR